MSLLDSYRASVDALKKEFEEGLIDEDQYEEELAELSAEYEESVRELEEANESRYNRKYRDEF